MGIKMTSIQFSYFALAPHGTTFDQRHKLSTDKTNIGIVMVEKKDSLRKRLSRLSCVSDVSFVVKVWDRPTHWGGVHGQASTYFCPYSVLHSVILKHGFHCLNKSGTSPFRVSCLNVTYVRDAWQQHATTQELQKVHV